MCKSSKEPCWISLAYSGEHPADDRSLYTSRRIWDQLPPPGQHAHIPQPSGFPPVEFTKELHRVLSLAVSTGKQFITFTEKPTRDRRDDWLLFYCRVGKLCKFSELQPSSVPPTVSQGPLSSSFLPQNSGSKQKLNAIVTEVDLCAIMEPHTLRLPVSSVIQQQSMDNSRNRQVVSFKSLTWGNMVRFRAISVCPTRDMRYQCSVCLSAAPYPLASHSIFVSMVTSAGRHLRAFDGQILT